MITLKIQYINKNYYDLKTENLKQVKIYTDLYKTEF